MFKLSLISLLLVGSVASYANPKGTLSVGGEEYVELSQAYGKPFTKMSELKALSAGEIFIKTKQRARISLATARDSDFYEFFNKNSNDTNRTMTRFGDLRASAKYFLRKTSKVSVPLYLFHMPMKFLTGEGEPWWSEDYYTYPSSQNPEALKKAFQESGYRWDKFSVMASQYADFRSEILLSVSLRAASSKRVFFKIAAKRLVRSNAAENGYKVVKHVAMKEIKAEIERWIKDARSNRRLARYFRKPDNAVAPMGQLFAHASDDSIDLNDIKQFLGYMNGSFEVYVKKSKVSAKETEEEKKEISVENVNRT